MRYMRNAIRPVPFHDCTSRDQLALQDTLELVRLEWQKATRNKWNARAANLEMLYKDLAEFESEVFGE